MHLGSMRVHADLYRVDSERSQALRFRRTDHYPVGLDLYVEQKLASVGHQFQEIAAQKNLAAAEGHNEHARFSQLIEDVLELGSGHLAVIVMIEITMRAAL